MANIYEGMFLIDNNVVRESWDGAKELVTGLLEKHGAKPLTARRWDERRLAYPIKKRQRATYLLAYFEGGGEGMTTLRRDLELNESILRYLILNVDALPEGEQALSDAERSADFVVPAPPEDDQEDVRAEQPDDEGDKGASSENDSEDDSEGGDEADEADEKPKRAKKAGADEDTNTEAEVETASKEG